MLLQSEIIFSHQNQLLFITMGHWLTWAYTLPLCHVVTLKRLTWCWMKHPHLRCSDAASFVMNSLPPDKTVAVAAFHICMFCYTSLFFWWTVIIHYDVKKLLCLCNSPLKQTTFKFKGTHQPFSRLQKGIFDFKYRVRSCSLYDNTCT